MKHLKLGVFLPIAKNGFIRSTNAPAYIPSYRDNLEITLLAEEMGLDYVFSMLKWRGFGGATQFWDMSFDSFSLTAALAAATHRLELIATVNPLLHHPASMAKMAATLQDVSAGRLGLNIVTGSSLVEYTQMGIVPDDYDRRRYEYATEWVQVLKRLWTEPSVSHEGTFFRLEDCVSEPKPSKRPFLVCAGTSDEGFRFTAREADYIFFTVAEIEGLKALRQRAMEIAIEEGRRIDTCTPIMVVLRDTRAEAEAYWDHLSAGADDAANENRVARYSASTRERHRAVTANAGSAKRPISSTPRALGSPQDVADRIVELATEGQLDNICMLFPDYVDGLRRFREGVLPRLREALNFGEEAA
jgi:pyrimidine oxygenase